MRSTSTSVAWISILKQWLHNFYPPDLGKSHIFTVTGDNDKEDGEQTVDNGPERNHWPAKLAASGFAWMVFVPLTHGLWPSSLRINGDAS
jgi:hypothetical protein